MNDKIFYSTCLGLAIGVLWRSFLSFDAQAAFFMAAGFLFFVLFFSATPKKSWGILVSVFILAFSLGIFRFSLADKPAPEIFQSQVGQKISLSGIITDAPVEKENGVELTVATEENGAKTKIILFAKENTGYKYGDEINFAGKLEKPTDFMTDQIKEFDYVNYLRKDGIFYVMRHPQIDVVASGGGNSIKRALFDLREKLAGVLNAVIPAPGSLVMRGLVLGERASFSEPLRQAFVNTGLIHIVVISGYHVALVAQWIMKLLSFLPFAFAAFGGIFTIFLYVLMTGGAQTAIRAGIMAALALTARLGGRLYDAGRALTVAGVFMILLNPFILAFDTSFKLSFLATAAVIFFAPRIEKYFTWIKWKRLRDIASVTSAVYVFILPLILYEMGNLSLVTLPANLAVLPLIPATMIIGFATGFAGLASKTLALILGKAAYVLLYYELAAIGLFSRLPFASLTVPDFPLLLTVFIYATLFWYLFAPVGKAKPVQTLAGKTGEDKANFTQGALVSRATKPPAPPAQRSPIIPIGALLLTLTAAGWLYYRHYESNQTAKQNLQALLANAPAEVAPDSFAPAPRTKSSKCQLKGTLPDGECTPGAVFANATVEQICVRGYTQTVRSVSTKTRKEVYAEYGIEYPQPRGAYEVDHLIPLALGGSNDIANLWTEAALPAPGFHEKDIVEVYLQEEVCSGRVALPSAQHQIAMDWLAVYNNLSPEEILALKKKYGGE